MASQVHEASPADLVIWLEAADGRCGAKAAQLGRLLRTGFHVPAGFVVVDALGDDSWAGELEAALRQLGPGPFAVRSSAMCEDGPEASYAGQLDTTLGVTTPREVADAVRSCAASGNTLRTLAYATRRGHPRHPTAESSDPRTVPASVPASVPVIVQLLVPADVSGVLFTRHPVTGGDAVIIEAAPGLGDQVVEGRVTPQRWGVSDHVVIAPAPAPGSDGELVLTAGQVLDIARTGRLVEAELAGPQDIEWALADGVLVGASGSSHHHDRPARLAGHLRRKDVRRCRPTAGARHGLEPRQRRGPRPGHRRPGRLRPLPPRRRPRVPRDLTGLDSTSGSGSSGGHRGRRHPVAHGDRGPGVRHPSGHGRRRRDDGTEQRRASDRRWH